MSDIYRVRTALAGGSGSAQVSTMFFSSAGGETAQDAATAVSKLWLDLSNEIYIGYTMAPETDVFTIDPVTGEPTGIVSVTATARTGGDSTDPLPWMTQGLIRWTTGTFIAGRQVRGRTFIPGATEAWNTGGVPNTTYKTQLTTALTTFLTTVGVTPVIYSRHNHSAWPVINGSVWTKWAELRTRRD